MSAFSVSLAAITAISVSPNSMTTTISTERRYRPSCDSQGSSASVASVVIEAAEHRGGEAQHQRLLRLPFLGHRIAVERGRSGAARAGNLDEDGRDAAGEVIGAVKRDHERQCLLHRRGER